MTLISRIRAEIADDPLLPRFRLRARLRRDESAVASASAATDRTNEIF